MEIEYINLTNYSLHIALLFVKIILIYKLIKHIGISSTPKNKTIIIISPLVILIALFTIVFIISELMFLKVFDDGINFYYYEFIAILDEIVFTVLFLINFMKGESDGKNTN